MEWNPRFRESLRAEMRELLEEELQQAGELDLEDIVHRYQRELLAAARELHRARRARLDDDGTLRRRRHG